MVGSGGNAAASSLASTFVNPIFTAALEIQAFFHARDWRFCVIGGVAVQRWGEPRLTHDVDCTVLAGLGSEAPYIDGILGAFAARIEQARAFALTNRVLLISSVTGVPIDVALSGVAFEERMIERASRYRLAEAAALITCSAEDLVVLKAFAGRDRDWADIEGILQRQAGRLDADLVWRELEPLLTLKEDGSTDAADKLRRLFRETRA
jgi:hypothetical protein